MINFNRRTASNPYTLQESIESMFDYENMHDELKMKKERFLTQDQIVEDLTKDEPKDDSI